MFHHRIMLMAGIAALAAPGIAQANDVSRQVDVNAIVDGACGMGSPVDSIIDLGDLTGPDGALDPQLTGTNVAGHTIIADAWCNTPHKITMKATPMALQSTPAYAQPAYMARKLTYQAKLKNWLPGADLGLRPLGGGDITSLTLDNARAAAAPGLDLQISDLETLNVAGNAEQPNLMLEVGHYLGTVTITLETNP